MKSLFLKMLSDPMARTLIQLGLARLSRTLTGAPVCPHEKVIVNRDGWIDRIGAKDVRKK